MPAKTTIKSKKVARTPKKVTVASSGKTAPCYSIKGELLKQVKLPEIFDQKVNSQLVVQAVRVYSTALRHGTASTKTRGQVTGSTRKIYRQKGTGRARHGSIKAPIFVGGGIVFGPKPRNYELNLPKKMRKQVLFGLLSSMSQNKQISVIAGLDKATGKTKELADLIKKLKLQGQKIIWVLTPNHKTVVQGASNLEQVILRPASALSALDLIKSQHLILAEESLNQINQTQKTI